MRSIRRLHTVALATAVMFGCSEPDGPAKTGAQAGGGVKSGARQSGAKNPSKAGAQGQKRGPGGKSGKPRGGGPPALVELAVVAEGTLTDGWTYLGRVEPALATELATAVSGHVISVKVREGDRVAAKKSLVLLDSAKIRAELAASRAREQGIDAELAHAKKQFERVAELAYPAVSEPERERFQLDIAKLEAQLAVQRAETRRLQVEFDRHSLEAPFAGVVSARHVDPGAWVNAGTPVLGLVSLDELEIHVDVSADLGSRLKVGQTAALRGPGKVSAEVVGVVGVLDAATRTMRVRLIPTDPPAWLLGGMAVDVEFAVTLDSSLLGAEGVLVPRDALVRGPVRTRVIKFVPGEAAGADKPSATGGAQAIYVKVLATAKDQALVHPEPDEPPLVVGDRVVTRGNERLRPGQTLRITGPKNGQ